MAPVLVQGWTSFKLKEEDLRPIIKNISCPVLCFIYATFNQKSSRSGKGKTAGRGVKGQKARSGVSIKSFEGGYQGSVYYGDVTRGCTINVQIKGIG